MLLPETWKLRGKAGVRAAHESQIGNELCIAYIWRLKEERWGHFTVNRFGVDFGTPFEALGPAVQLK